MRMDPTAPLTASDVVNGYPVERLATVLAHFGEERFARRIAEAIVRERSRSPLTSSARLAELVRDAVPAATRRTGGHPAKRTFQALRIEVNDELGALARALPSAVDALRVGGRIAVLAYHSLEDRIVKRVLAAGAAVSAPPDMPLVPEEAAARPPRAPPAPPRPPPRRRPPPASGCPPGGRGGGTRRGWPPPRAPPRPA